MPAAPPDYFRYFPHSREAVSWGVAVTAVGYTHIRPHTPYPPGRHPKGHHFEWSRGRVLEALQVVLITAGRGEFEQRGSRPQRVEAGDAFMLFPGFWHRYRPDPATGWDESWVELAGDAVDRLCQKKILSPGTPVLRGAVDAGLDARLEAVHARAREPLPGFDAELAVQGLAVLAAWKQAGLVRQRKTRLARAVAAAERHFAEHLAEPVNIALLARQLGVAYSHFRAAFKAHTGYAPWQYVVHLRLAQARRQLAASDATLDEVAGRLGFSSAFHLSAAFKRACGVSPAAWRRRLGARK
ncbi:MAG: helix-turn-helix transcriptional regulator [Verrucomicrobia bacterium]|nr:helix-turn-helix transcriptional regulator [Verrucomicrobiota bacterium]